MIFWDEEQCYKKVDELRKENSSYDEFISLIETKLSIFIEIKNNQRLYRPRDSTYYRPRIIVKAFKMTLEEYESLLLYLKYKYIDKVRGDKFLIKKKLFGDKYVIYTKCYDWYDCYD